MKWRPYPQSLFSRLVILLLFGLLLAVAITVLVMRSDRGALIQHAVGIHNAQRIATIVKILEQLPPDQRHLTVAALDTPGMRLSLDLPPIGRPKQPTANSALFLGALRYYLEDEREIRYDLANERIARHFRRPPPPPPAHMNMNPRMHDMMRRHLAEAGLHLPADRRHLIQVQLKDGAWLSFGEQLPEGASSLPGRLLLALGLVLLILGLVALLAVRWITRPLAQLTESAEALGRDLQRPPLDETGPEEVRATLHAFNNMQSQIRQFVEERSRFLAAISHDLKTPITRLRLRAGLLEDEALSEKFDRDLTEMEVLVQGILEFMREEATSSEKQAMDINDLLETLQLDAEETGNKVTVTGRARQSYRCNPLSMRRLITNLVDNAIKYGEQADIRIEDTSKQLQIEISDKGPGIPVDKMEQVFQPFSRLESSRNRESGGTGLGLTIARNIVLAHGGQLTLKNRPEGGLMAVIRLPR